jgi:hypothetical protein
MPSVDGGTEPDGGTGTCSASDPGTITRTQLPLSAGLHATFRIATDAAVSPAGAAEPDGGTYWDLSGMFSGDQDVVVQTLPITGQWFATSFPTATYATPLSNSSTLLGVFEETDSALMLDGVVSPTSGLTQTLLSYSPPVTVLAFPLQMGGSWQSTSTVSGQAEGVDTEYEESYTDSVDAQGTVLTPFGPFAVLRVNVLRSVALIPTDRTYSFVTACFGPIASMVSVSGVTEDNFPIASEVRRLAP